jgi:hypothetical protein
MIWATDDTVNDKALPQRKALVGMFDEALGNDPA